MKTAEEFVAEWDAEQIRKRDALYHAEFRSREDNEWHPAKEDRPYAYLLGSTNIVESDIEIAEEKVIEKTKRITNLVRIRQLDTTLSLWENGECVWRLEENN